MDTEIELKFLTSDSAELALPTLVERFVHQHQGQSVNKGKVHLTNTYFDTSEKSLRHSDIGFRVRSSDGRFEQTIKTAGKVVAGLHQRPEYNITIEDDKPDLMLFDREIFPDGTDVGQWQRDIEALFTTDFYRSKWVLSKPGHSFELVFDQGVIESLGVQQPICELELELLEGDGSFLFEFAEALSSNFNDVEQVDSEESTFVRLGFQSKAMRGYLLYNDEQMAQKPELETVKLKQSDSIETAFVKTMEHGLAFMQHHEQCFIEDPNLSALRKFTDGAALIRHALTLFDEVANPEQVADFRAELKWILTSFGWVEHARQLQVVKSQRGIFRKKLDKNEALAQIVDEEAQKDPKLDDIKRFFSHPRYIALLLSLSRFILKKDWRNHQGFELKENPPGTLHEDAAGLLNNAWQSLLSAMPKKQPLSIDDYMFHHKQLKRSLLTGTSLGGLYISQMRDEFRLPWIDLSKGIDELKTLDLLKSLAAKLDSEQGANMIDWLDAQIETLLMAMEQSRRSAIKMKTYWSLT